MSPPAVQWRPWVCLLAVTILLVHWPGVVNRASAEDSPVGVNFANDVVPLLTKAGCNSGVCHAKAGGGQNGFQLSLLGFEPQEDYEHLTRAGRGRRLFPAAPDQSLLLLKASGQVTHGGGVRLPVDSHGYRTLRQWIIEGTPATKPTDPILQSIRIEPSRGMLDQGTRQSLRAWAEYSDSSVRDVTDLALYESNDNKMATVDEFGMVTASDIPGKVSIMVRYQGQVAVYNASIPLGAPMLAMPPANNFIDQLVFANLAGLGIPPSPVCDDATYLRRVTLDLTGRLPTASEANEFLADVDPNKRRSAVEKLLRSSGYADYFAGKWTSLLKNRRDDASDITANFAFHAWVRDSLLANVSYDQFVKELLAATGTIITNPSVAWYKRVKDPKQQLEDVAQLFLGVRLQCAQCHHHPFERWSQDDYYALSAFFSRVGRKPTATRGEDLIFHERGIAAATNVKTSQSIPPRALGDSVGEIPADEDPRLRLADWMSAEENPFFAKALVNRYWKHFFKRALVEPEDDIRDTNPASNPELLAALERHFIESGFDLKDLVRVIVNSSTYQLSSVPNEHNLVDRQNYSRFYPKRLPAEVLLDAIDELTLARTEFANLPSGTRAIALPDNSYNKSLPFLRVFGRPENTSVCECERDASASLAQSLHLMNAPDIQSKLAFARGRAQQLAEGDQSLDEKINQLYLVAFSRPADVEELVVASEYLTQSPETDPGASDSPSYASTERYQDLLWALINTKEFLFNH